MKIFFVTCLLFLQCFCFAQINKVAKFRVIDSFATTPVMDGKIIVSINQDTLAVATIENGFFSISCQIFPSKNPMLTIICQNYDTLMMHIDSSYCISDAIQIIRLKQHIKELQEVIITSPLIRQDIDKITYNVAGDLDSKTLTLLEFMPKLPFISLAPDDNLLLKGKSNFIVLLNGRRSSIFSNKTLREALKAISAANISKIEIITDPPSKYENEGYIGVINIVTVKSPSNGYNAAFNSSIGTFVSGTNGTLNYKRNKFGFIFEGGANIERTPYNSIYSKTICSAFEFIQRSESKVTSIPNHGNLLFSYELDSLNLITLDFGANASKIKYGVNSTAEFKPNNSTAASTYLFCHKQDETEGVLSLSLNYQKNFKNKKDRLVTLSYLLGKSNGQSKLTNTLEQSQNFNGNNYSQFFRDRQLDNAIQLDYVHPVKKLKIESGAKYIHRNISSNFSSNIIDQISGVSSIDTLNTGDLKYELSILGVYNSYLLKLKSYSLRAGFRFENTTLNGTSQFGQNKFKQQYSNLLPSLKIQYKSKKGNIYGLGFKQQIQRPGIGLLNPLISFSAPNFGNSGNPDLNPVLINNINFEFSKFKKASISLALSYTFSKNTIQGITTTLGDTLVLITFENIGKYQRFGIENSIEIPISSKIDLSIDGSLFYVNVESKKASNLANHGIEGFAYSYLTYRLKKNRFTANVGYYGPTVNIQAKSNSYFYSSLGLSRQILKSKGNISFRIANPFQKYRMLNRSVNNSELTQYAEQKNLFRGFYLSFNFRFGKLDEEVKKNKRSLQIDDAAKETGKMQ